MKTFEDICRMTQQGVKGYMHSYLVECGYSPTSEDGFLYAKGDICTACSSYGYCT